MRTLRGKNGFVEFRNVTAPAIKNFMASQEDVELILRAVWSSLNAHGYNIITEDYEIDL